MFIPTPVDSRLLSEVEFAWNVEDLTQRALDAERVRSIFARCGAKTAQDAIDLGCTGLAKHGVSVEDSQFVRDHMAGAQFSLTCFVSPKLYCKVHETSGGLQVSSLANEAQEQKHAEMVSQISRPLLPTESAHVALIENAMRLERREKEAKEMLKGRTLPEGWEAEGENGDQAPYAQRPNLEGQVRTPIAQPVDISQLQCPEHGETYWRCRFCVAVEVIRGDLVPTLLMCPKSEDGMSPDDFAKIEGSEVPDKIQALDAQGVERVVLLARVAVWTKKLAR